MLTMADEGGRGVWTLPFLADIICEQPLRLKFFTDLSFFGCSVNMLFPKKKVSVFAKQPTILFLWL